MSKSKKIIIGITIGILIIGAGFLMLQKPSVSGENGNPSALEHMIRPIMHGGVPGDGGGG